MGRCVYAVQGDAEQSYLVHGGQPLDSSKTLADYSIQQHDTLELLLRLRCVVGPSVVLAQGVRP